MGQRNDDPDDGSSTGGRLHRNLSTKQRHSITQIVEPMPDPWPVDRKTNSIILHHELGVRGVDSQHDTHFGGVCVPGDIRERFLDDAKQACGEGGVVDV
jgi:hypothetical protein